MSRAAPMRLDWRVQPDDRTASFLELRAAPEAQGMRVRLTPPDARWPALTLDWLEPGKAAS